MKFILKILFAPVIAILAVVIWMFRLDAQTLRLGIRYHRHNPRYPRSCDSSARQRYQRHHRLGNCVPR